MQNQPDPSHTKNPPPVGLGSWMLILLIMLIPLVNIIMLFVWAFGENTNPSKLNWARATLLWLLLLILLYIILFAFFGASLVQSV